MIRKLEKFLDISASVLVNNYQLERFSTKKRRKIKQQQTT